MLTGPKWKAAFYIDERASKEQFDLLVKIFSGQAGGFFAAAINLIGEVLGIKLRLNSVLMESVAGYVSKIRSKLK
jgi:hypothetical protein